MGLGRAQISALFVPAVGILLKLKMRWSVIADFVGIVGEPTIVRLMAGLRSARTGILTLLFLVGGRWFRRRS